MVSIVYGVDKYEKRDWNAFQAYTAQLRPETARIDKGFQIHLREF